MKKSMWSNPYENFIGRREVGYGIFIDKTVIAEGFREKFLNNLSRKLEVGQRINIIIIVDNKEFKCEIDRPNNKGRQSIYVRLDLGSELKNYLKSKLSLSYNYIIENKEANSKKQVMLPNEYKEYLDFYLGKEKDQFILKIIKAS